MASTSKNENKLIETKPIIKSEVFEFDCKESKKYDVAIVSDQDTKNMTRAIFLANTLICIRENEERLNENQINLLSGKSVVWNPKEINERILVDVVKKASSSISFDRIKLKNYGSKTEWINFLLSSKNKGKRRKIIARGLKFYASEEKFDVSEYIRYCLENKKYPSQKNVIEKGEIITKMIEEEIGECAKKFKRMSFNNPLIKNGDKKTVAVVNSNLNFSKDVAEELSKKADFGLSVSYDIEGKKTIFTISSKQSKIKMSFIRVNSTYYPGGSGESAHLKRFEHQGFINISDYDDLHEAISEQINERNRKKGAFFND